MIFKRLNKLALVGRQEIMNSLHYLHFRLLGMLLTWVHVLKYSLKVRCRACVRTQFVLLVDFHFLLECWMLNILTTHTRIQCIRTFCRSSSVSRAHIPCPLLKWIRAPHNHKNKCSTFKDKENVIYVRRWIVFLFPLLTIIGDWCTVFRKMLSDGKTNNAVIQRLQPEFSECSYEICEKVYILLAFLNEHWKCLANGKNE